MNLSILWFTSRAVSALNMCTTPYLIIFPMLVHNSALVPLRLQTWPWTRHKGNHLFVTIVWLLLTAQMERNYSWKKGKTICKTLWQASRLEVSKMDSNHQSPWSAYAQIAICLYFIFWMPDCGTLLSPVFFVRENVSFSLIAGDIVVFIKYKNWSFVDSSLWN